MLILSSIWLGTLALTVLVHWLLPAKFHHNFIILATCLFLAYHSPISLLLLSLCTIILATLCTEHKKISGKRLAILITIFAAILISFKIHIYLSTSSPTNETAALGSTHINSIFIPLGMSYYIFRCIHYAVEKYKGVLCKHTISDMISYLFFLPTLIAGPIHRFENFHRESQKKRWDSLQFIKGLERILIGYVKVVFISNFLIGFQFEVLTMALEDQLPWLSAYLSMIKIALNIYVLFSGYSDIAIGFGMLLGIKVMENFNRPYLAKNISEFWTRWHISLTSWCKDYVYMGTISTTRSAALAALAAMIVMGLWHEASPRYLIWGFYHGAGIMLWQIFQNFKEKLPAINNHYIKTTSCWLSTVLTLHFFAIGTLIVQHDTLKDGLYHIAQLFLIEGF